MASEVEICNLALAHIRAGSINSLDEASVQAQYCKLFYPVLRDQMLEDSPWQFARGLEPLAVLEETLFNWVYVYQYPTDCLHINRLVLNLEQINSESSSIAVGSRYHHERLARPNFNRQVEYKIYNTDDNKVIASNHCELRIDYRKRITDLNLFSNSAILALSHLLASELATPLVGVDKGRPLRSDELTVYKSYLGSAIDNELNEQFTAIADSEFINVR